MASPRQIVWIEAKTAIQTAACLAWPARLATIGRNCQGWPELPKLDGIAKVGQTSHGWLRTSARLGNDRSLAGVAPVA